MLSIGIVGLPNVGKSTLFNALTEKSVPAENYPFCTIDPSVGVVAVPDERLNLLSRFSASVKSVPAAIEFVDIAGLVKGASEGEGLGNKFLSNVREVDAIMQVVRIFEDGDIAHVDGDINPLRDIEVINLELILADFQTVSKRLANVEKDVKRGDKNAVVEKELLKKIETALDDGKFANSLDYTETENEVVKGLHLLTMKPMLYVLNKKAGAKNLDEAVSLASDSGEENDERYKKLIDFMREQKVKFVIVDAGIEGELSGLGKNEKLEFRKEFGVDEGSDGVDDLIKACYDLLGLMTYFTSGEDETRAWTIKKNSTAPAAGAVIHSDFKDKFIRAEVINWKSLLDCGSYASAREKGLIRTEGKEYIVQDGDVIEFKI